ncbi:MAG: DUF1318 domain-containing protein [bacterium]
MRVYFKVGIFLFLFITGCTLATVNVDVVSERTALENQVLGTYNSLDNEMLLVASVRGVDSDGHIKRPPHKSQEHQDAISAMQLLSFHEDDLQSFKRLGWVGENNEGFLTIFGMKKETIPSELKEFSDRYTEGEFQSVVEQINNAREIIMRRVIDLNENFSEEADMLRIRRVFGKLNADNALPGEMIQTEDGAWILKE